MTLEGDSLAQLVEHIPFKDGVLGSNPRRITKGSQFATLFYSLTFLIRLNLKKRCWNGGIYCTLRQKTMSTLAGSLQPACMPMPAAALTRSDAVSDIPSGFAVIIRYFVFRIDKKTDGMLLKHAVRHYRDKVMFDCLPAYLAMIFSTFEPVRRM